MGHTLHIRDVIRWVRFNEYEGEVHGDLDGVPVMCYVLAVTAGHWDHYRPGTTVRVDAWLERWRSAIPSASAAS